MSNYPKITFIKKVMTLIKNLDHNTVDNIRETFYIDNYQFSSDRNYFQIIFNRLPEFIHMGTNCYYITQPTGDYIILSYDEIMSIDEVEYTLQYGKLELSDELIAIMNSIEIVPTNEQQ